MKKTSILLTILLLFSAESALAQANGGLKSQIVNALDGVLNNPTWKLSSLDSWDDDETISRMNFMIDKTVSSITSLIPNLKPSEQREVYALYSDLMRFSNDLDFEFQVVTTLRTLCEKYPILKQRPLLWIFSSKASEQLSEVASGESKQSETN